MKKPAVMAVGVCLALLVILSGCGASPTPTPTPVVIVTPTATPVPSGPLPIPANHQGLTTECGQCHSTGQYGAAQWPVAPASPDHSAFANADINVCLACHQQLFLNPTPTPVPTVVPTPSPSPSPIGTPTGTPGPTPSATPTPSGAPVIPADHQGRTSGCGACHATGLAGAPVWPVAPATPDHSAFANADINTCLACHPKAF